MPYDFNFDLSGIPRSFFRELSRVAEERQLHKRFGLRARDLAERFKLSEATGLDVETLLFLIEDLVDVQIQNMNQKERFVGTRKRALFLPHCARKHMDGGCKASFDTGVPTYRCAHCSGDCLVGLASALGDERGYSVFVVPGGSCIPGIMKRGGFEGIVGVACGQELMPALQMVQKYDIPGQAVPLIKNGCANTVFSLHLLEAVL
ncbi:MAG: DUF116 domain-containing protein [Candidatus Bathyarchaeota archaeon]|nr:DUF116 domain-containing protein [Candidatus Bathyarchaeota archaeon]